MKIKMDHVEEGSFVTVQNFVHASSILSYLSPFDRDIRVGPIIGRRGTGVLWDADDWFVAGC